MLVRQKRFFITLSVLLASCLGANSIPVQADGFHYQVQASTEWQSNSQGELTALQMHWTYDTAMAEALELSKNSDAEQFKQRAEALANDLLELGYFSQLAADGQPLAFKNAEQYSIKMTEQGFIFNFTLPLKTSLAVKGKTLSLSLADPDGIGILSYQSPAQILLDERLAKQCSKPTISTETIRLPGGHQPTIPTVKISCDA